MFWCEILHSLAKKVFAFDSKIGIIGWTYFNYLRDMSFLCYFACNLHNNEYLQILDEGPSRYKFSKYIQV